MLCGNYTDIGYNVNTEVADMGQYATLASASSWDYYEQACYVDSDCTDLGFSSDFYCAAMIVGYTYEDDESNIFGTCVS